MGRWPLYKREPQSCILENSPFRKWKFVQYMGSSWNPPGGGVFFWASLKILVLLEKKTPPSNFRFAGKLIEYGKNTTRGGVFFWASLIWKVKKKPTPLGLFPRNPCTTVSQVNLARLLSTFYINNESYSNVTLAPTFRNLVFIITGGMFKTIRTKNTKNRELHGLSR